MPDANFPLLIGIIVLAVGFGFTNGLNDAANAIATAIGTRAMSPRSAVAMAAVCNFAGAATGLEVARTIGKGILIPEAVTLITMISALASVIIWGLLATYRGLPVSITHGFLGGFLIMVCFLWVLRRGAPNKIRSVFSKLQIPAAAFVAYAHGKNDGQMPVGVITMALVTYYGDVSKWEHLSITDPSMSWVIILSALAISSGMALGGRRVIKTVGMRMTVMTPVQGFTAQASAAVVIETASQLGIPVSTTHCVSSSIMGVGATKRVSAVRWGIAGNIVAAWILTFPICGLLGYFFSWVLHLIF